MKIYIDQNVNLKTIKKLKSLFNFEIVQNNTEQSFEGVPEINKAFTIGMSTIDGPDVIAGDDINLVKSIIGNNSYADIGHIYSAHINKCDYFITENIKDFINNCKRTRLETILHPIKIRRLDEFIKEIKETIE